VKLTVVVPTYNVESTRGTMRQCLESVVSQDAPADEIIVVDSSDDGTTDVIREFEPAVRLIHLPQRTFAGDALNLGVREANGEAIAFIDSDCIAERTWIKGIREGYAQNDGAVGVTGPIRGPENENIYARLDRILHLNHLSCLETAKWVTRASTTNLSVRRQPFMEIGGFPENLLGNKDYIMCKKLTERFGPLAVHRDAVVYHLSRDTLESLLFHQRRFGHGFVAGRTRDPSLSGAIFARHPSLIPLMPVMRAAALTLRLSVHHRKDLMAILGHPVLFARALSAWTKGAWEAAHGKDIEGWDAPASANARPSANEV